MNLNNILNISLELISKNLQSNIKNIIHTNLLNSVTYPRIQYDNNKDTNPLMETTEISEKTNFKIIYNKNMQDIMNNIFFPENKIFFQRNTINFSLNSISFRDLPLPLTQLNVTTSNIMEVSNLNNLNFNTQPNEELILKRRSSNTGNFNRKIKNYYLETDKKSNLYPNDTFSNNLGSVNNLVNRDSIASKTLKHFYDKIFLRKSDFINENNLNTNCNTNSNNLRNSLLKNFPCINQSNRNSYNQSFNNLLNKPSVFSNNKSFINNLPRSELYTIEDYDDNYQNSFYQKKLIKNKSNINVKNKIRLDSAESIKPFDKLARNLYYSFEVRSRILEKRDKKRELMLKSLSELEEEYNEIKSEINPIFNIKNAIDDPYFVSNDNLSKRNIFNNNRKNNTCKNKKGPVFEINIKDLIKDNINERILTDCNKEKSHNKSNIIKYKNLNINNININIQTNTNTEANNYSNFYKKKPKILSNENLKENIVTNASSEFINSIEIFTKINHINYIKKGNIKVNSGNKNENKKFNSNYDKNKYSKNNIISYSNSSLKNKYSNISPNKKIDMNKYKNTSNKDFDLNNISSKRNLSKTNNNNLNNKENIISNIIIKSQVINDNESNEISIDNKYLRNVNIPPITITDKNSCSNNSNEKFTLNTLANNLETQNNLQEENTFKNKLNSEKNAFSLDKCTNNFLISESKSYAESEISSFDSKELATLQNESIDNEFKIKNKNYIQQNNSLDDSITKENFNSRSHQEDKKLLSNKETSMNLLTDGNNERISLMKSIPNFFISIYLI